MEESKQFINELLGKTVSIQAYGGSGIKEEFKGTVGGNYKGTLLGFDGNFIKLEYDVSKFINGKSEIVKRIMIINLAHIITVEEFQNDE